MTSTNGIALQRVAALIFAVTVSVVVAPSVTAQNYPAKPIRFIIPFPPGGTSDILARLIGPRLSERWGQQVVVDNRPGASGALGAEVVARAAPDGYTLMLTDVGSLMISQILSSKPVVDLTRDYAPVTLVSYSPHLFCVHPSVPVANTAELIALAKRRPGALNFASSPAGAPYLAGLMFAHRTGVKWEYITGKGGVQSVLDVMSGQADVMFNGMLATLPHVKSGKLKLIAVTSEKRVASLSGTPTVAEHVPGFVTGSWQGILAPAGTSQEIVARLNSEITRILNTADVREKLTVQGADPLGSPAAEAARFLRDERDRWSKLIKETGYKIE